MSSTKVNSPTLSPSFIFPRWEGRLVLHSQLSSLTNLHSYVRFKNHQHPGRHQAQLQYHSPTMLNPKERRAKTWVLRGWSQPRTSLRNELEKIVVGSEFSWKPSIIASSFRKWALIFGETCRDRNNTSDLLQCPHGSSHVTYDKGGIINLFLRYNGFTRGLEKS